MATNRGTNFRKSQSFPLQPRTVGSPLSVLRWVFGEDGSLRSQLQETRGAGAGDTSLAPHPLNQPPSRLVLSPPLSVHVSLLPLVFSLELAPGRTRKDVVQWQQGGK